MTDTIAAVSVPPGKARLYARAGIPWLWWSEPTKRALRVLELQGGRWRTVRIVRRTAAPALPPFGTPLSLEALWWPEQR